MKYKLTNTEEIFVDTTHVKACANSKKSCSWVGVLVWKRTAERDQWRPTNIWFCKGEHKHVFAYAVETACGEHGRLLGYSVDTGNEHDSWTFQTIYEKIKSFKPDMIVADTRHLRLSDNFWKIGLNHCFHINDLWQNRKLLTNFWIQFNFKEKWCWDDPST